MTELEILERRLERWRTAVGGPNFIMHNREKAMRELKDQIAKLKGA
jgi:hypothetical protein